MSFYSFNEYVLNTCNVCNIVFFCKGVGSHCRVLSKSEKSDLHFSKIGYYMKSRGQEGKGVDRDISWKTIAIIRVREDADFK